MNIFPAIDLDLISIVLLIAILLHSQKKFHTITKDRVTKLFMYMIIFTITILLLESIAVTISLYKITELIFVNTFLYILYFSLTPIIFVLWLLYLRSWISFKINYVVLFIPFAFTIFISLLNFKYPIIFYIDSSVQYNRGPLYFLPVIIAYIYLAYGLKILCKNRKLLDDREFKSLTNFIFFPSITAFLQMFSSQSILFWSGVTAAIILFYIFLLDRLIMYDQLTNSLNRVAFESNIHTLINSSNNNFSMLFLDLDDFKKINDTYGHSTGDKALIDLVKLLKRTFENEGQVFRFGGDEFIIILQTTDADEINTSINRLNSYLDEYNKISNNPYTISLSYGFDVYNNSFNTFYDYINHLDMLMYEHKNSKRKRVR